MNWVLVLLVWSFDGSAFKEYPTYWYDTQAQCEHMLEHFTELQTLPSTAETFCEPAKYYTSP